MTEIREDVVAALVASSEAAARERDRVIAVHSPTPDELRLVAQALAIKTVTALEDAGVLRHSGTVLDLRKPHLAALAAVYGLVGHRWASAHDGRSLGDLLKVIPREEAENVVRSLAWARLLPRVAPPPDAVTGTEFAPGLPD